MHSYLGSPTGPRMQQTVHSGQKLETEESACKTAPLYAQSLYERSCVVRTEGVYDHSVYLCIMLSLFDQSKPLPGQALELRKNLRGLPVFQLCTRQATSDRLVTAIAIPHELSMFRNRDVSNFQLISHLVFGGYNHSVSLCIMLSLFEQSKPLPGT